MISRPRQPFGKSWPFRTGYVPRLGSRPSSVPGSPYGACRAALLTDDDQLKVLATLLPLGVPLDAWLDTKGKALRISARITSIE